MNAGQERLTQSQIFEELDQDSYLHLFTDPSLRDQLQKYLKENRQIFINAGSDKSPTIINTLHDLIDYLMSLPSEVGLVWLKSLDIDLNNKFPVLERLTDHLQYDRDYQINSIKLIKFFEGLNDQEKQQFLADYFNEMYDPAEQLTQEDFEGLEVVVTCSELEQLRKRYGYIYQRIVFKLDLGAITRIRKKISGTSNAYGFTASTSQSFNGIIPNNFLMIFTPKSKGINIDTMHELKHSMDFNLTRGARRAKDKVLEEFAGLYVEILYPRVIKSKFEEKDKNGNVINAEEKISFLESDINYITQVIKNAYFQQYKTTFKNETEFKDFVDQVGKLLQEISTMITVDEMDRLLMNAKSIQELQRVKVELMIRSKISK